MEDKTNCNKLFHFLLHMKIQNKFSNIGRVIKEIAKLIDIYEAHYNYKSYQDKMPLFLMK